MSTEQEALLKATEAQVTIDNHIDECGKLHELSILASGALQVKVDSLQVKVDNIPIMVASELQILRKAINGYIITSLGFVVLALAGISAYLYVELGTQVQSRTDDRFSSHEYNNERQRVLTDIEETIRKEIKHRINSESE